MAATSKTPFAKCLPSLDVAGTDDAVSGGASQPVAYAVRVEEGTILADELATSRKWRVDRINLQYNSHGAGGGQERGSLAAEVFQLDNGGAAAPAGRIAVSLEPGDGSRKKLSWQADRLSLAVAEPWLRRAIVAAEMSGTLSSQGTANWTVSESGSAPEFSSSGLFAIDALGRNRGRAERRPAAAATNRSTVARRDAGNRPGN